MKIPMPAKARHWVDENLWLNETTKRKNFLLPYLLICLAALGGLVLQHGQSQLVDRAQANRDASQSQVIAVLQYVVDANTYSSCVSKSGSRDDLIEAIDGIYQLLDAIGTVVSAPQPILDKITSELAKFDTNFLPIDIATCGSPPTFPKTLTP